MGILRELFDAEAATTRRAVQARSRRTVRLFADARQLVLFQFAGNDFSVIGVAYGRPGHRPDYVVACPDPLNRADVATQLTPIRDDMLAWVRSHTVAPTATRNGRETFTTTEAPQLIVAGKGVISALDNLAYDWRYNPELDADWHDLGEELWHLTALRHRSGQHVIVPLAEMLADHYALGLSTFESAKLAVAVEICDAGPNGSTRAFSIPSPDLTSSATLASAPGTTTAWVGCVTRSCA